MDYERIHSAQGGVISPSKLRIKIMGSKHQNTKEIDGSNCNSSRTSPSRHEDSEFVKDSLLESRSGEFDDDEVSSIDPPLKSFTNSYVDGSSYDQSSSQPRENAKIQPFPKMETFHSRKTLDDDVILNHDSNPSSSSFEFQNGERSLHHSLTRSLSRPMSSKWNDAEKWIMNSQNGQTNHLKKSHLQNRQTATNLSRFPPEISEQKPSVRRVDFCQSLQDQPRISVSAIGENAMIDICPPHTKDLKEVEHHKDISAINPTDDTSGVPAIRSVSMRDMGTEMTPIPSQEPSRSATPINSTPIRSPTSSIPSTPRRSSKPSNQTTDLEPNNTITSKRELSEEELKLKTRREIVALGVQLGKMNIATWASKEEATIMDLDSSKIKGMEFDKIAAEWEEAEKAKHAARYKREEIQIQAWESQQKAKLEAELQRIEAKVSQMRANAQAKMTKKIAMARQRSEEKRAAAEARKRKEAERTTVQAEYIRRTGRVPSSGYCCCGW